MATCCLLEHSTPRSWLSTKNVFCFFFKIDVQLVSQCKLSTKQLHDLSNSYVLLRLLSNSYVCFVSFRVESCMVELCALFLEFSQSFGQTTCFHEHHIPIWTGAALNTKMATHTRLCSFILNGWLRTRHTCTRTLWFFHTYANCTVLLSKQYLSSNTNHLKTHINYFIHSCCLVTSNKHTYIHIHTHTHAWDGSD